MPIQPLPSASPNRVKRKRPTAAGLEELQEKLGHRFANRGLLERALTHSSRAHEESSRSTQQQEITDNEQLEFLGDAVLGLVTSKVLVERNPRHSEGELSKMRAHLVSAPRLMLAAQRLGLGEHLRLGRGEEKSGGRDKPALLADAMEAVIAAIYLDGGMEVAFRSVLAHVIEPELKRVRNSDRTRTDFTDPKSALQEALQAGGKPQPTYTVTREQGPEHKKTFVVELALYGGTMQAGDGANGGAALFTARGIGPTKKTAEQEAARQGLAYLEEVARRGGKAEADLDE